MALDRWEYKLPLGILPWVTQANQLHSLSIAPGLFAGSYHTCFLGSSEGFSEKNVSPHCAVVSDDRPGHRWLVPLSTVPPSNATRSCFKLMKPLLPLLLQSLTDCGTLSKLLEAHASVSPTVREAT